MLFVVKTMKKIFETITIMLTFFLIEVLSFPNITNCSNIQKNSYPKILYEQKVGNLTNKQIDTLWPSNNPRTWILSGTMDGEITKRYKVWHNAYKSQVKGTTDERGLKDNTDLTIYIKNLNISSSDYQDLRLIIDYLSNDSNTSLTHSYSMELYAIDDKHKKFGPFNVADFVTTGFYSRQIQAGNVFDRNFNIVSEKIDIPENVTIQELELKPYANFPQVRNAGLTIPGDWRGADTTLFAVAGIKIVGYEQSTYQRPEYIKYKKIDVNKTRKKIVKRMYDLATIKWIPSILFHDTRVVGDSPKTILTTYMPGVIYYGMPYTQRNRVTLECFTNQVRNNLLSKPDNVLKIWGADCASSVTYAISKYLPMHVIYNTTDFLWDRNKTELLGNLIIDGKAASSSSVKEKFSEQKIYEAYAELQKGDIVSTHHKLNTHVRLITGNTHINRNVDNSINPTESYFIYTDIRINQANTKKGSNDFGGFLKKGKDSIVPFQPNKQLTDIKKLTQLEGKNLNFNINKKSSFKEAYDENYIPVTLNYYVTSTSEEPYARIINPNNSTNIKKGLKGTIYSNYIITSVTFSLKSSKTGEVINFVDFPNHNTGTLEGMYGNTYSLYYNTPEYIKNYIKETAQKEHDVLISISVSVGEKKNLKLLTINT